MQLRCKYCDAAQSVGFADEADEDARTQGIRRTFRVEHETCGERAVSLVLDDEIDATHVDPGVWDAYCNDIQPPAGVVAGGDGFFAWRDRGRRVCEDCWEEIPRYIAFPDGLVSPESDGAGGRVPKLRADSVPTESPRRAAAAAHLPKAVCLPCYLAAFARVYPDAALPEFSAEQHDKPKAA